LYQRATAVGDFGVRLLLADLSRSLNSASDATWTFVVHRERQES